MSTSKGAVNRSLILHYLFENRRNEFVVTLYNSVQEERPTQKTGEPPNLLEYCKTLRSRKEIAEYLGLKTTVYAMDRYVRPMLERGELEMTIPERPKSRKQKDRTAKE